MKEKLGNLEGLPGTLAALVSPTSQSSPIKLRAAKTVDRLIRVPIHLEARSAQSTRCQFGMMQSFRLKRPVARTRHDEDRMPLSVPTALLGTARLPGWAQVGTLHARRFPLLGLLLLQAKLLVMLGSIAGCTGGVLAEEFGHRVHLDFHIGSSPSYEACVQDIWAGACVTF